MPNRFHSLVLVAALCAVAHPSRAAADTTPVWVPVIVDHADANKTASVINSLAAALLAGEDVELLDPVVAARRFEATHSATPAEVPDEELSAIGDSFREALKTAAIGEWDRAYEIVRRFNALSQADQDYATWRLNLTRDIFDYCLMSVNLMLNVGRDAAARQEMEQCIQAAPKRELNPKSTPENVVALHASVKAELFAQGEASLEVDARGTPASLEGCVVVVNGVPRGSLPYREHDLLPIPVRIQVNCRRPGRIHSVRLKPGPNSVVLDLRFEAAVRTEEYLGLRYADAHQESASQLRDALTLAKEVHGSDLLLVNKLPDGRLRLRRLRLGLERVTSEVTLAARASSEEIADAAHALTASRWRAVAAEPSAESAPPSPRKAAAITAGPRRVQDGDAFSDAVVVLGSVTSFALAWGSYGVSMHARNEVASTGGCGGDASDVLCAQSFARYQTLGDITLGFGALGAALGVAASPAALPPTDGVPVWSVLVGLAGVGMATAGAVVWHEGTSCALESCATTTDPTLGQLLVLQSPPLLAIPLTHAVRALLQSEQVEAGASYGPSSAELTVRGHF